MNDITVQQWTSEQVKDISICKVEYANFEFPNHFHDYYTILIVEKGVNQGFTDKHKYKVGPGTILIINPGEIHAGSSYAKNYLQFRSLNIEAHFLENVLRPNGIEPKGDLAFYNKPITDQRLTKKMLSLLNAICSFADEMLVGSYVIDFFFELFRNHSFDQNLIPKSQPDLHYLKKAKHFIQENYQENLTLADIAQACYVSEYHLVRQFQHYVGLTPFEYLRNYRVERARQLLRQKNSITQVALEVGFYDHSHFLKNFKKMTGMRPSQFRKSFTS